MNAPQLSIVICLPMVVLCIGIEIPYSIYLTDTEDAALKKLGHIDPSKVQVSLNG